MDIAVTSNENNYCPQHTSVVDAVEQLSMHVFIFFII